MHDKLVEIYDKLQHANAILDKDPISRSDLRSIMADLRSALSLLQDVENELIGLPKPRVGE